MFLLQLGDAGMAQWWERSSPTAAGARIRFPNPVSHVGWVSCWFSSLLEGLSPGSPVFFLHRNKCSKFQFDSETRAIGLSALLFSVITFYLFCWLTTLTAVVVNKVKKCHVEFHVSIIIHLDVKSSHTWQNNEMWNVSCCRLYQISTDFFVVNSFLAMSANL